MRLALRLAISLFICVLVLLLLQGWLQVNREATLFSEDTSHDDTITARVLAASASQMWGKLGEEAATEFIRAASRESADVSVRFVNWPAPPGSDTAPQLPLEMLDRVAKGHPLTRIAADQTGQQHVYAYAPVVVDGRWRGAVEVRESLRARDQYIETTIVRQGLIAGAAALLFGIAALVFGYIYVGEPMRRLAAAAARVGSGDLTERLPSPHRDEIGELIKGFNIMTDQLAQARRRLDQETEEKIRMLENVRRTDRLATVGTLASGVAHELGTPLNVIGARAAMVERGEATGADAARNAGIVREQSDRMRRIIQDLLSFARPRQPERTQTDLAELALSTVELLRPLSEKRGVSLKFVRPATPPAALVDAGQMQQVLSNLIMNAVQASPSGGVVSVSLGAADALNPERSGGRAETCSTIVVSDAGPGIDHKDLARIFEPFFTTKGVGEGTGLGLSVASGIVREHGGWIGVASVPGRGATFTIYLPGSPTTCEAAS